MSPGHAASAPALLPWIIAFKAAKSLLLAVLGLALLWSLDQGPVSLVFRVARTIHLPATSTLLERGLRVATHATPRKELSAALVAFAYAVLMGSEGTALYFQKPWAPWFTIGATASLTPIEVFEIVREPHVMRVIVFVVNVAVLVYLWQRRDMFAA